jgi:DNA-binding LacI/PurR family transcriptional regulator
MAGTWRRRRHEPTAPICFHGLSAISALSRLRELGIAVPGDMSVTGFDAIALSGAGAPCPRRRSALRWPRRCRPAASSE